MLGWPRRFIWRTLRWTGGWRAFLGRRLTPVGRMVLAGTLMAGLLGLDTRQTLAHQAFSLGVALLLVAWLAGRWGPAGVRVRRHLPRHATLGVPFHYGVELVNLGSRRLPRLEIQETLPDPRPDLETFLNSPAPGERQENFLDRLVGFPRWRWLVGRAQRVETPQPMALPPLRAGGEAQVELELTPRRRGYLVLPGLRVGVPDPLGLTHRSQVLGGQGRVLVLPQRYPVPPQRPPGRRRFQPGGLGLAGAVGDSQEFVGLREYRPGDSMRHLHWAAWARTGQPMVKEYQDEYHSRQALVLDSCVAPGQEDLFEAAISVAASLVEPLRGGDTLLDMLFVADQVHGVTSGRGLASGDALLEVLAGLEPARVGGFQDLSQAVLESVPRLSACLCLFLSWDGARQELVRRLRGLGLPPRVLLVAVDRPRDLGPWSDQPEQLLVLHPERLASGLAAL